MIDRRLTMFRETKYEVRADGTTVVAGPFDFKTLAEVWAAEHSNLGSALTVEPVAS